MKRYVLSDSCRLGADLHLGARQTSASPSDHAQRRVSPTTAIERFLLMITIAVLPLEDHIPTVAGFSILFCMFGVLAGYVCLHRFRTLGRTWLHPVFLAAYTLLFLGFLIESAHDNSSYTSLIRFGLMIGGAILVAVTCRDKQALRAGIYGYMTGSVWLSALLFLTSYGALQSATATNYDEASWVRGKVSEEIPLEVDLNNLAFLAGQGGIVALALTLTSRSTLQRTLFFGVTLFCLIATFLPMSRGGILIAAGSSMTVLLTYRGKRVQGMLMAIVLAAGILSAVPNVVFSRMDVPKDSSRTQTYTAYMDHLSEFVVTGVGAGNFWKSWRFERQIYWGAHNIFLQVVVLWGLAALLALLVLIWQAYRCIPKRCGNNSLALCLPGLAVSLLLMMMFTHGFYDKWYSLGLGLLVGVRHWIWPTGLVESETRPQTRFFTRHFNTPPLHSGRQPAIDSGLWNVS